MVGTFTSFISICISPGFFPGVGFGSLNLCRLLTRGDSRRGRSGRHRHTLRRCRSSSPRTARRNIEHRRPQPCTACCQDGQRQRRDHEQYRRDRGRFRKQRRRAARAEGCLRAHSAERTRQVRRFSALQQHHDDQEDTDDNVNRHYQGIHRDAYSIGNSDPLGQIAWLARSLRRAYSRNKLIPSYSRGPNSWTICRVR